MQARGALHALAWTPDGRRLLTGAASGSFSLWDGASFNFETMLQVRSVVAPCADPWVCAPCVPRAVQAAALLQLEVCHCWSADDRSVGALQGTERLVLIL